jgi:hypothetical protein
MIKNGPAFNHYLLSLRRVVEINLEFTIENTPSAHMHAKCAAATHTLHSDGVLHQPRLDSVHLILFGEHPQLPAVHILGLLASLLRLACTTMPTANG